MEKDFDSQYAILQAEKILAEDTASRVVILPQPVVNELGLVLARNDASYHNGELTLEERQMHMESNLHSVTRRIGLKTKREFNIEEKADIELTEQEMKAIVDALSDERAKAFSAAESRKIEGISRGFKLYYEKAGKLISVGIQPGTKSVADKLRGAWSKFKNSPSGLDEIG